MNKGVKNNCTKILALLIVAAMTLGMNENVSEVLAAELHAQESASNEALTEEAMDEFILTEENVEEAEVDSEIDSAEATRDIEESAEYSSDEELLSEEQLAEIEELLLENAADDEAVSGNSEATEDLQEGTLEDDETVNFELDDKLLSYFVTYYRDRNEFLATLYEHPQDVPVEDVNKIKSIVIYYDPDMGFDGEDYAQITLKDICKFKNLETLIVYGDNRIKIDVGDNAEFFPSSLKKLVLQSCIFTEKIPDLNNCKNLEELDIRYSSFADGIDHIIRGIDSVYNKLGALKVARFDESNIKEIVFPKENVSSEGLVFTANNCRNLERLELNGYTLVNGYQSKNKVQEQYAPSIRGCSKLSELVINGKADKSSQDLDLRECYKLGSLSITYSFTKAGNVLNIHTEGNKMPNGEFSAEFENQSPKGKFCIATNSDNYIYRAYENNYNDSPYYERKSSKEPSLVVFAQDKKRCVADSWWDNASKRRNYNANPINLRVGDEIAGNIAYFYNEDGVFYDVEYNVTITNEQVPLNKDKDTFNVISWNDTTKTVTAENPGTAIFKVEASIGSSSVSGFQVINVFPEVTGITLPKTTLFIDKPDSYAFKASVSVNKAYQAFASNAMRGLYWDVYKMNPDGGYQLFPTGTADGIKVVSTKTDEQKIGIEFKKEYNICINNNNQQTLSYGRYQLEAELGDYYKRGDRALLKKLSNRYTFDIIGVAQDGETLHYPDASGRVQFSLGDAVLDQYYSIEASLAETYDDCLKLVKDDDESWVLIYNNEKSSTEIATFLKQLPDSTVSVNLKVKGTSDDTSKYEKTFTKKVKLDGEFSVGYNLNGGNWPDGVGNKTSYSIPASNEADLLLNCVPMKKGYYFAGWTCNGTPVTKLSEGVLGDLVLAATWKKGLSVENITESFVYTGKAIKPEPEVYDGATKLVAGVDYTVTYKNNVNAASKNAINHPTVIVTGKGNYDKSIKVEIPFEITEASFASGGVQASVATPAIVYDGRNHNLIPTVTYNGIKLANGKQFILSYEKNGEPVTNCKETGDYTIKISAKPGSNYTGSTTVDFKILEQSKTLMSKVSVDKIKDIPWGEDEDGNPVVHKPGTPNGPGVVVKYGKNNVLTLEPDGAEEAQYGDYKIVCDPLDDYSSAGTHSFTITAGSNGKYFGSKTVTFNISGVPISKIKVSGIANPVYDGTPKAMTKAIMPGLELSYTVGRGASAVKTVLKGRADVADPENDDYDYDLVYLTDHTNAGTVKVQIIGRGKYSGTATKSFSILPKVLTDSDVSVDAIPTQTYVRGGVKAQPVIKYTVGEGTLTLTEGVDYKLAYSKNSSNVTPVNATEKQKASVTITGMKNYKGKLSKTYEIAPADFVKYTPADPVAGTPAAGDIVMIAPDVVENLTARSNASKSFVAPILIEKSTGTVLKAGTDYDKNFVYKEQGESQEILKTDAPIPAGTTITVTVTGKGNYSADTITAEYKVIKAEYNIASYKGTVDTQLYTGEAITLTNDQIEVKKVVKKVSSIVASDQFEILTDTYTNNEKCGTASVYIRGTGDGTNSMAGLLKVTFKIVPQKR